ncbi:MAG TPA: STAS domain-containing protein [Pseudomonadales bacterium]|nr:STAS domain-containing protein [Pseudomonadales bacterium]
MIQGQIQAAHKNGAYLLRLVGDVRVTLCATFDDFLEKMFSDKQFASVNIDLCQAEGIDSTSLGLLAKLAIQAQQRYDFKPIIFSSNTSITRILESMGFEAVFDIRHYSPSEETQVEDLPQVNVSEGEVCKKVVEAHRILMGMNDDNNAKFRDLIDVLESQCPAD